MKTSIDDKVANRIRWGYLTALILLLGSYLLSYYTTSQLDTQTGKVDRTNEIIYNLEKVLSDVKDAETGLRGYYLTDDENFLAPYKISQENAESTFNKLASSRIPKMDSLKVLINRKYQLMADGLAKHVNGSFAMNQEQRTLIAEGKLVMDKIRSLVYAMQGDEQQKMDADRSRIDEFSRSIKVINLASLIVALLLAIYSILTFNKENRARKEADAAARAFRAELEKRVEELDKLNRELIDLRSQEKFAVTGRISRTIAHEVRNPLTNINLAIEHLRTELPENEDIEVLLDMVSRNANRINVLISDLLNSTRAAHLNFEKASLNKLLDESLELAQDRLKLHNIKVMKSYDDNVCDIMVDPEKIKIAFLNIMVNAIEAMDPQSGVLKLSTKAIDNKCIVTIADNGKGMDKESVSKLFEPYFTTKENGTGLGLTNSHNIILNHKALVRASSELGKGTTFTITFSLSSLDELSGLKA